ALERVRGAEEVAPVADLHVRVEREARVVDGGGGELGEQQDEQLEVRDELLERGDEAALQPAGRLPADVRAREKRSLKRVQGLVPRLEVDGRARGERAAAGTPRQPEPTGDLPGRVEADRRLGPTERGGAALHVGGGQERPEDRGRA